jgi:hypothetical protein
MRQVSRWRARAAGPAVSTEKPEQASRSSSRRARRRPEAGQLVRSLDAHVRYRFKNDQQALGAWISASAVFGQPGGIGSVQPPTPVPPGPGSSPVEQSKTPEAGGDVRPAA